MLLKRIFKIVIILLPAMLLFFSGSLYCQVKKVMYDSALVKTISPSPVQEKAVFEQVDLDFAKTKEHKDIGLWERTMNAISELFFGDTDESTVLGIQKFIIWLLVIAGIGVIVWLLTRTEFSSFLRGNTKNTEFNFSDVEEDISGIDFDDRIAKALKNNDYRLAIRWLYLKQLYLLNQKNAIAWQPFKTNIDYTAELSKAPYQRQFIEISRIYDYVWYGKYDVSAASYSGYEKQFREFEKTAHV